MIYGMQVRACAIKCRGSGGLLIYYKQQTGTGFYITGEPYSGNRGLTNELLEHLTACSGVAGGPKVKFH
jgi:hypothetical protein